MTKKMFNINNKLNNIKNTILKYYTVLKCCKLIVNLLVRLGASNPTTLLALNMISYH